MKVAILHDDVVSRRHATLDEVGVLEAVQGVEDALLRLGHLATPVPAGTDPATWSQPLRAAAPDLVFNLCEGLGGQSQGEILAARTVERLGIPMTGSSSWTLALSRHKDRVNALLEDRGLPVPSWARWDGWDRVRWASAWRIYPAIVKPAAEDGSVGITQASVVRSPEALARQLAASSALAPLLVQAFVGSREINVGVVGGEVLPLAEIEFSGLQAGLHPMVDYQAKWAAGTPEDLGSRPVCPAPLPPSLAEEASRLALEAWEAVGGRGYGRVDFRLTEPGTLHVLEVNPNPDLAPSAGLARMALARGWDFTALVERILVEALTAAPAALSEEHGAFAAAEVPA